MAINIALKKYLLLVRKYGHDKALKMLTKYDLNSMYKHLVGE